MQRHKHAVLRDLACRETLSRSLASPGSCMAGALLSPSISAAWPELARHACQLQGGKHGERIWMQKDSL